jgi:hypothetical protein
MKIILTTLLALSSLGATTIDINKGVLSNEPEVAFSHIALKRHRV